MGFLAPLGGLIGGLFSGGSGLATSLGGLAGSLFGGFGGQSSQQQRAASNVQELISQLSGTAESYSPVAANFYRTSAQALPQALNFWAPLIGGDRTAAASVLAPDINRINEQYDQILQNTMGSRTGAGASIYAQAPYERQAQIQSLYSGLRPQAATQMGSLASTAGGLGQGTLASVLQALGQALGGGQGLLNQSNLAYQQSQQAGSIFGSLIADVLDQIGG